MNGQPYYWPQPPRLDPRTGAITPAPGAPVRPVRLISAITPEQVRSCAPLIAYERRSANFASPGSTLIALVVGAIGGYLLAKGK